MTERAVRSPEAAEVVVAAAEAKLVAAGVPNERWLYISANGDYTPETPADHRLGGFSCDRRWLLKDCIGYPMLHHTVVDGADLERVLAYIGASMYFLKDTDTCVYGTEGITVLVKKELEQHKTKSCSCTELTKW